MAEFKITQGNLELQAALDAAETAKQNDNTLQEVLDEGSEALIGSALSITYAGHAGYGASLGTAAASLKSLDVHTTESLNITCLCEGPGASITTGFSGLTLNAGQLTYNATQASSYITHNLNGATVTHSSAGTYQIQQANSNGLNINSAGVQLYSVNGTIHLAGDLKTDLGTAPASATATGAVGQVIYTTDYVYVCTATDTWKRTSLATW